MLYAFPMFLAARKSGDADALPVFGLALVIGTVIADPLVAVIGAHFPWMVRPDGRPLVFAIGLLVNPVAQPLVKTIAPLVVEYLANLFPGSHWRYEMTISNSLVVGVCLVLAGNCGLVRHFLLEPKLPTTLRHRVGC